MLCLALLRRACGFDLVFLEQTVSLIADEDPDTQYLMQVRAVGLYLWSRQQRVCRIAFKIAIYRSLFCQIHYILALLPKE